MNNLSNKKILVTGANGLLGSSFCTYSTFKNVKGFSKDLLDITSSDSLEKKLDIEKPDIILHTAAFTNVEACENNPEKAFLVNVLGTKNLAKYCKKNNVSLIYISSTGVYGSSKTNVYSEFDSVKPTTVHHKTKYEAEMIVSNTLKDYLILRTGWLYGGSKSHNKNFVYHRYMEAKNNNVMHSNNTQIGNPTYVIDLVNQIDLLITENVKGLFNCVNSGESVSRYNYVFEIIKSFNLNCQVKAGDSSLFKRVAPVSNNESAINSKLNQLNINIMGEWKLSLNKYINILKQDI